GGAGAHDHHPFALDGDSAELATWGGIDEGSAAWLADDCPFAWAATKLPSRGPAAAASLATTAPAATAPLGAPAPLTPPELAAALTRPPDVPPTDGPPPATPPDGGPPPESPPPSTLTGSAAPPRPESGTGIGRLSDDLASCSADMAWYMSKPMKA